jgi:hypothetical protein
MTAYTVIAEADGSEIYEERVYSKAEALSLYRAVATLDDVDAVWVTKQGEFDEWATVIASCYPTEHRDS